MFISLTRNFVLKNNYSIRVIAGYRYNSEMNIVNTPQGKLQGCIKTLPNGDAYASFKGIPYAKPPIGKLRFLAPQPPEKWEGVLDASKHRSICPQYDMFTGEIIESEENCLFLNVYTKSLAPKDNLSPVMFWIHGGAYVSGSGNSDMNGPEYLLEQDDVVIVTINYRLEVLGFLCLDNELVPGNAGLKDQAAALMWVKNNIAVFGGDPDNVTLFGESAGASSATLHMASPLTRGLFHKVIAQSGAPICDWATSTHGKDRAFRLGKLLGKETDNTDELFNFLQSVPASKLIKVTMKTVTPDEKIRGLPLHFSPVFEKRFANVEPFLPEEVLTLLQKNELKHVPLLMGYNSAEGLLSVANTLSKKNFVNDNFHCKVPREVYQRVPESKGIEFGNRIKKFYFNDNDISDKYLQEICNLESDIYFTFNCHRFADIYSKQNENPVYFYIFDCVTELNIVKRSTGFSDLIKGASHADDLFYLFHTDALNDTIKNDPRLKKLVNTMCELWTNFARTGNPTQDSRLGITWPRYDRKEKKMFHIDENLTIVKPDLRVLNFWTKIYTEAGCITPDSKL